MPAHPGLLCARAISLAKATFSQGQGGETYDLQNDLLTQLCRGDPVRIRPRAAASSRPAWRRSRLPPMAAPQESRTGPAMGFIAAKRRRQRRVTAELSTPGWPTALAIVASGYIGANGSADVLGLCTNAGFSSAGMMSIRRLTPPAIDWLLEAIRVAARKHTELQPYKAGHDSMLVGWPWVTGTHSWIEPTAWAVLRIEVGRPRRSRAYARRRPAAARSPAPRRRLQLWQHDRARPGAAPAPPADRFGAFGPGRRNRPRRANRTFTGVSGRARSNRRPTTASLCHASCCAPWPSSSRRRSLPTRSPLKGWLVAVRRRFCC